MALKKRKRSLNVRSEHTVKGNNRLSEKICFEKLESCLGFQLKNLTSFNSFCQLMFRPTDPSSLAIVRICFGKTKKIANVISMVLQILMYKFYVVNYSFCFTSCNMSLLKIKQKA